METAPASLSLWDRKRRDARAEITDSAMRLFVSQGFEATTIEQIVAEVGISRRSFFRYFGNKEDVVMGDLTENGNRLLGLLESQPEHLGPWEALRGAFTAQRVSADVDEAVLVHTRLLLDTPALRARHLQKHAQWHELLAPNIALRLGLPAGDTPDPRALAIVGAALGCLDIAVETWTRRGGAGDPEQIYDEAVAAIRT
jgi:AcrR family transcriptional regulator